MSSRRSRSGGRCSSTVFSRKNRSSRNRPAATSARTSALVAARMRTSTRRDFDEPTRSNSPVCSTRSSLACCAGDRLAISSRKSVPPSASSNRPTRSARASVNAPFTCPNSSLSNTPSASPPRFTVTMGRTRRGDDGVEPSGDDLLAGAVFAGDERVGVGRSDALHEAQQRLHGGRPGDELRRALGAQGAVLALQPLAAADGLSQLDLGGQQVEQPRVVPRLLDVVARAALERRHRALDAAPRGHHDHRQRGVERLEPRQQIEALDAARRVARVVHVHEQRVEVAGAHRRQHAVRRGGGLDAVALAAQEQAQRFEHVAVVVGDEDAGGRGGGHGERVSGCGARGYHGSKSPVTRVHSYRSATIGSTLVARRAGR